MTVVMHPEIVYTATPLVTTVPITTGSPFFFRPCVRLVVDDLVPGDLLDVTSTVQVSSKFPHAVMVGRLLKASDTNDATPSDGQVLSRPMATNISAQVHHLPVSTAGALKVSRAGRHFVTQVLYSASTAASPGDVLPVDYAEMTVRVWRRRMLAVESARLAEPVPADQ